MNIIIVLLVNLVCITNKLFSLFLIMGAIYNYLFHKPSR